MKASPIVQQSLSKSIIPILVVGIILLLIVPIPTWMLDALIVVNLSFALLILLTTMFAKRPLDFSVFPSLLLIATLFRLGLNVASTRLVLGEAHAGQVIQAFGELTISGNIIIGAVIFLILTVIQFVVITKGSERVAEVGARFKLDAMPGKQMAIDADLNAGLITEEQARTRRAEVAQEADFYGAMDGASRFVKGDAIAGVVIVIINFVGGLAIGVMMNGMEMGDALETYTLLTIGDGLATQVAAFLMAIATGMIVTRENVETEMGLAAGRQLMQSQNALLIVGSAAALMGFIPGMPTWAFLLIGAALIFASTRVKARDAKQAAQAEQSLTQEAVTENKTDGTEDLLEKARVHALEISLSPDIVDLASGSTGDLLTRTQALRKKLAGEIGFIMPTIRIRDNVELPPQTYSILVSGVEAGRGTVPRGHVLALGSGLDHLPGTVVVDPVFGLEGKWVPTEMSHAADMAGATVIDRASVVITHLSDIVKANAHRLLSLEDVRQITDHQKQYSPSLIEELTPSLLSLAAIQRVLATLLLERVPINDIGRIYEALALRAKTTQETTSLVEAVRTALGPAISARFAHDGVLRVLMLDPIVEQQMLDGMRTVDGQTQIVLPPDVTMQVLQSINDISSQLDGGEGETVLVCAPMLRSAVQKMVAAQNDGLAVLSYDEAAAGGFTTDVVGAIRVERPASIPVTL